MRTDDESVLSPKPDSPTMAQETLHKTGHKESKSQETGRRVLRGHFLGTTQLLQSDIHSRCGCLHWICPDRMAWMEEGLMGPYHSLLDHLPFAIDTSTDDTARLQYIVSIQWLHRWPQDDKLA